MRILIVEDDPELVGILARGFGDEGLDVECACTFADGRQRALHDSFDVVLLDIMLPDGSGFDLCRQVRERGITTPILILTARDSVSDRVVGLESGADDYLTKPFDFRELLARVHALGRRPQLTPETYRLANLSVNLRSRLVTRGERLIRLTAREWDLLEFFVRHVDQVVRHDQITSYIWNEHHDPFSNVLEVLIGRLRRKLDDPFEPKLIHTIRGAGYRFGQ